MANQYKNFDELPESIQEALLSPETIETIHDIGMASNLPQEKIHALAEVVTDVFMNSSQEANLVNLVKKLGLDSQAATEVTKNLLEKVINPIKSSVSSDSQLKIAEEVAPLSPSFAKEPPIIPQGQETTTMVPTPIQAPLQQEEVQPTHEVPFILHKEEEVEPVKETPSYNTQRPVFYKPTFSEEYKRTAEAESAARVELGEEIKKTEPRAERTPTQPPRIVHYSEFKTQLNPFENTGETQTRETTAAEEREKIVQQTRYKKDAEPSEVHPNNIIDLKDLPLE